MRISTATHTWVDPHTFQGYSYGPVCCTFRHDIMNDEAVYTWVKTHYAGDPDADKRIWVDCERMIRYPWYRVYLDTREDAMLFKLSFANGL